MSRKGNCWDNAVAEAVPGLKTEWLLREGYRNSEAVKDVVQYLSGYYNRVRPHKNNGGLTPAEMERQRTSGLSKLSRPLQLERRDLMSWVSRRAWSQAW
jgi:putative transposase